jgi:glycosyltransferase involved in cell wall biosynthesis
MALRILYVGLLPPHEGGASLSSCEILAGLAARGHTVHALTPITPAMTAREAAFARAWPGISTVRYPIPEIPSTPDEPDPEWYRAAQTVHLDRLLPAAIRRHHPGAILIGRESFAPYVADVARARGIPVVQRLAGAGTNGLLGGRFPEPLASEMRAALRQAQARVSPGRELAVAAGRLDIGDVLLIRTGVDLDRFQPREKDPALLRELDITRESIVVAHMSNLKALKRPLDLVRAAGATVATEKSLVFLVVGDGALRGAMEAACREAGIARHFRFVGWRSYDEMPRYFNLADMVAMPSESEGLARAYLETQACGRVLIASDIAPAREVVRHGQTGLLFPGEDNGALSDLILMAARDPALRRAIGARARRQAQTRSVADTVAGYEALLTDVAEGRVPVVTALA